MGARRLLALINGLPVYESAFGREALGDARYWDVKTELAASTVDLLKLLAKSWGADLDDNPYPRPESIQLPKPVENIPVVSASAITSFLEGI